MIPVMLVTAMVVGSGGSPPVGTRAPEFTATATSGTIKLSDYRGKWVVLYFYPKSFTPGCTAEACSLRDGFDSLRNLDAVIIGVSTDDVETQRLFKEKYQLPFDLIADTDKKVVEAYHVAGMLGFAKRRTFIIDPSGVLRYIVDDIDTRRHADQIRSVLQQLRKNG
ncbi:MAG: peroxiredoxin [Chlorobi bacterium]|nr:peroxiredoxin [Chlorobiota bacterium]